MRFGNIFVGLMTALMLVIALFFGFTDYQENSGPPLSVVITTEAGSEEVQCWKSDSAGYYVFLPSYAPEAELTLRIHSGYEVILDGALLTDGMDASDFQGDVPYEITCTLGGVSRSSTLMFVYSEKIPALYLHTQSGSMEYVDAAEGNQEPGTLRIYSPDGQTDSQAEIKSINLRGNGTLHDDKKPYGITLSTETDLLGMGHGKKWILLANAYDASHLKNKMVYDLASELGLSYSPDCEWVDVFLNGEYVGLYLLSEKNEVHVNRVAISESTSFLVSKEREKNLTVKNAPYLLTEAGLAMRVHHNAFDEEKTAQILQSVETAILAEDGIDPVTGKHWSELIDPDSWARKYLLEEVVGNCDSGFGSQFFYHDESDGTGKVYAGPVWDYDASMLHVSTTGFVHRPAVWLGEETPWFYSMYQKPEFYDRLLQLYQAEFLPAFRELLDQGIDAYLEQIHRAAYANQIRWSMWSSAEDAAETIRSYLTERMEFLQSLWYEDTQYYWVMMYIGEGSHSQLVALKPGQTIHDPVGYYDKDEVLGWYTVDTDEPVDITQPVYEDMEIYLKYPPVQELGFMQTLKTSMKWFIPFLLLVLFLDFLSWVDNIRYKKKKNLRF